MTIATTFIVQCDSPDLCDAETQPAFTVSDAYGEAEATGWRIENGEPDLCPAHNPKEAT